VLCAGLDDRSWRPRPQIAAYRNVGGTSGARPFGRQSTSTSRVGYVAYAGAEIRISFRVIAETGGIRSRSWTRWADARPACRWFRAVGSAAPVHWDRAGLHAAAGAAPARLAAVVAPGSGRNRTATLRFGGVPRSSLSLFSARPKLDKLGVTGSSPVSPSRIPDG
jgi:hypothetical protein